VTYTLHLGDCLDVLPTIASGSIDAVIADPPYGTTACKWDSVIPLGPMWAELKRVIKPRAAIVLFGTQPFTSALITSNPDWFKYEWIWDKKAPGNVFSANKMPLKYHENIFVFYGRQPTYNPQRWIGLPNHTRTTRKAYGSLYGSPPCTPSDTSGLKYPRSIIEVQKHSSTESLHPTQKPVALMSYLIRTYTNAGETVLDFCYGSGTTGVAALMEGRNFVGMEKDAGYYALGATRIEQVQPLLVEAAD
jgi:site-specific DNA-methyltransferase (adenine-specific)